MTSAIGIKKRKFLERTTLSFCLTIFCSIITARVVGDKFFMRTRRDFHFNEAKIVGWNGCNRFMDLVRPIILS